MISKEVDNIGVIKYKLKRKSHNPHGPAVKSKLGSFAFYINGNQHNIVGPYKSNIIGIGYAIKGKLIRHRNTLQSYNMHYEDEYQ